MLQSCSTHAWFGSSKGLATAIDLPYSTSYACGFVILQHNSHINHSAFIIKSFLASFHLRIRLSLSFNRKKRLRNIRLAQRRIESRAVEIPAFVTSQLAEELSHLLNNLVNWSSQYPFVHNDPVTVEELSLNFWS